MNTTMTLAARRRLMAAALPGLTGLLVLGGCSSALLSPPQPPPALYALDGGTAPAAPAPAPAPASAPTSAATPAGITLLVDLPRAAPGHDTALIAYVRRPPQLEYFASNQWVAPPAQMLAPLLVRDLQAGGSFRAVTQAPTAAQSQWRLETSGLQLLHDFTGPPPSRVRLSLRAVLLDTTSRRVLATRELQAQADAPSDDPAGGVLAARAAARELLRQVREFCVQTASTVRVAP